MTETVPTSAPTVNDRPSPVTPAGRNEGKNFSSLSLSTAQPTSPLQGFGVYVVGFHCVKDDPSAQMEAHHYIRVANDDLLQCFIFDGNTAAANLIGIEYMVSGWLYARLPDDERTYWHPHNFEVLSGQLTAPGLTDTDEKALMTLFLNTYGKTWHTWHTGRHDQGPGDGVPMGEAKLMWSFNRDGECDDSLKQDNLGVMGIDPDERRQARAELRDEARPQHGVDAMKNQFADTTDVPGVVDADAGER